MQTSYKLTSEQLRVLKNLAKEYGKSITIGELIENVEQEDISKVTFSITGNFNGYCYECSGEKFDIDGTIVEIIEDEADCEVSTSPAEGYSKLSEILSEKQLQSVVGLLMGVGLDEEPCREFDDSVQSSPVTEEQILAYLKTLYVKNYNDEPFEYKQFICEF